MVRCQASTACTDATFLPSLAHMENRYYFNTHTGESSWVKPWTLGSEDIEPSDAWQELEDADGSVVYFQESTGRYTTYSETQAALIVQRAYKNRMNNVGRSVLFWWRGGMKSSPPWLALQLFKTDVAMAAKALTFIARTQKNFVVKPTRVTSILNMALLCHTIHIDFDQARLMYGELERRNSQQSQVLYARALFILADQIEYPRKRTLHVVAAMLELARASEVRKVRVGVAHTGSWNDGC